MTRTGGPIKGIPRWVEAPAALVSLIIVSPFLLFASLLIALTSPGPVIFRQRRVGKGGTHFTLYKFRTMRVNQNAGPEFTAGDDERITAVGWYLRKTKLDELPELWNVLKGDMSLVGPRPEVPRYVNLYCELWREVLRSRPGITDPVTLRLRNEETLLAGVSEDREQFYKDVLLPYKLREYKTYSDQRSFLSDLVVIWKTAVAIILPGSVPPPTPAEVMPTPTNRPTR